MSRRKRPRPVKLVTEAQQQFTFSRRALFLGGVQLGIGGLLAARMGYISIVQNEKYELKAESNRVNLTLMLPRRGWIVDAKGVPLALNRTSFRVDIIPDRITDEPKLLGQLQGLMKLTDEDIVRIRADIKKAAGFQPVAVGENIPYEIFAAVSIRAADMPGVAPSQFFTRFYPEGPSVGHLIGYVGAPSAKQYEETRDPLLVTPGYKVGKDGLEKVLEERVRGVAGAKRTEVTARGKLVRDLATKPDVPGQSVRLTIDAGLQDYAGRRMGNQSGSAVIIDCETGGILALNSMPCYDPNAFSDGIGRLEWRMMQEDEQKPMLNKSLQGLYPPGSTLKPVAAIALQMAGIDPEQTVYCGGGYVLGGRRFQCLGHHGAMNMRNAIMKSCNTYFYAMAHRVGYDRIAPIAKMLGLGQRYDLPMPSQYFGTIPDSAWLKKKFKRDWGPSDSLNATIGQGYVLASPLQLALSTARIASGRALLPRLFHSNHKPDPFLAIPPEMLQVARDGMDRVVNSAGTAVRSRLGIEGIQMAGKTGTAQVRGLAANKKAGNSIVKYRDHGLFVFFAPVDKPKYAGAVVIEHGMGGAKAAAPVAKDLMTYLFEPERAMATLSSLEAGWGGPPAERMKRKTAAYILANSNTAAVEAAAGSVEDEEIKKKLAEEEERKKKEVPAQSEAPVAEESADSDTPANAPTPRETKVAKPAPTLEPTPVPPAVETQVAPLTPEPTGPTLP